MDDKLKCGAITHFNNDQNKLWDDAVCEDKKFAVCECRNSECALKK